jgi:hypothetical protein
MNAQPKKIRRWRRRLAWTGGIFVFLVVAVRLLVPLLLPAVMGKIAGAYGMTCTYDRVELNLTNGDANMWGLKILPKDGGDPILATDYCHGNVSVLNLLRGRLDVWRVEADGVDINLNRQPDGTIPLLDKLMRGEPISPTQPAAPTNTSPSTTGIDLTPPLKLDAFRLTHVRVHFHDAAMTPPMDTVLAMDLRLSDLGSNSTPAKFELTLSCDPILDSLHVEGEGHSGGKILEAQFHGSAWGLRLKEAAAYLQPLGIRPVADGISLRFAGQVATAALPNSPTGFAGTLQLQNLTAVADRTESLALDKLSLDAQAIEPASLHFTTLILQGVRAYAQRDSDGLFSIAGIEWDPSLVVHPQTQPATAPPPNQGQPSILAAYLAEKWQIDEVALRDLLVKFHDDAVPGGADLSLASDEIALRNIDHDPQNLQAQTTLTGHLKSPGLIADIALTANAKPFADDKTFAINVDATGIKPDALQPYFDEFGIQSDLNNGHFNFAANGDLTIADTGALAANVHIPTISFSDKNPLLSFGHIDLTGLGLDPSTGRLSADTIEIVGPKISGRRDAAGALAILGLRRPANAHVAFASLTSPPPSSQPSPQNSARITLPKIDIGRFVWKNIQIDCIDDSVKPSATFGLSEAGIALTHFSTDAPPTTQPTQPGYFRAWLASPNLADHITIAGTVQPSNSGLSLDMQLNGDGITFAAIDPYLKSIGIEPILKNGTLQGHAQAQAGYVNDHLLASLQADKLHFMDGPNELAALDGFSVKDLSLDPGPIAVDSIQIDHPHLPLVRDTDGTIIAAGMRIDLAKLGKNSPPAPPSTPPASPTSDPLVVLLNQLNVNNAQLDWTDRNVQPTVQTTAQASVFLDHLSLNHAGDDATLKILASASGIADNVAIVGTLRTPPHEQTARLDISASGLALGPLTSYLPPGTSSNLKDGTFHTTLDTSITPNPQGGRRVFAQVGPLDYQNGDGHSLFKWDGITTLASRVDLPEKALTIDELTVNGIETNIEKTPQGGLSLLGLVINSAPPSTTPPAVDQPQTKPTLPPSPSQPVLTAAQLLAVAHRPLPVVTINNLDLNLQKLSFIDQSRPAAAPLVLQDFHLKNVGEIDCLGPDPLSNAAAKFELIGQINPLADRLEADLAITPFGKPIGVRLDWEITGIRGDGLTQLVPELSPEVNGSDLTDGNFTGHLEAQIKLDRTSPIDFNLSHRLDLDILLHDLEYRATPDGPILLGLKEARSEGIAIEPAKSLVRVKSLQITRPIAFITRDKQGVHILGWTVNLPPNHSAPTNSVTAASTKTPVTPPTTPPSSKPKGEIRIDELLISELDARFEDTSADPPLLVPLNALDVEVHGLSTLAPYEDRPIRFSAVLNSDKIMLPSTHSAAGHQTDLFTQIDANGNISLYPELHGWAKTSVSGLELAALRGEAQQQGVTLSNGTFDSAIDARFNPDRTIDASAKFIVTDLSVSESSNGPISRVLRLPAPLDVAVAAVEGADGSITLPVNLRIENNQVSRAQIAAAATGAVSNVIVTAVASAPLKVVGGLGSLVGLDAGKKTPQPPIALEFAPGSVELDSSSLFNLTAIETELKRDPTLTVTIKHELGTGDLQWANSRANPSPADCQNLQYQLRAHKADLLAQRAQISGQARAQLIALGESGAANTIDQLKAIDRDLANTEDSLDQVVELLRPGAEKQADRRTRAAAIEIGNTRLDAVDSILKSSKVPDINNRIDLTAASFKTNQNSTSGRVLISVVQKKD